MLSLKNSGVVVLGSAGLLVLLQVWVIVGEGSTPRGSLEIDLLQAGTFLLSAAACFWTACRADGPAGRVWTLVGVAALLITAAHGLGTYYDIILHAPQATLWPADVLYFVWVAPLLMALLPQLKSEDSVGGWLRGLDFLQIVIISLTVFLYFFYLPGIWNARGMEVFRYVLKVEMMRDALLALALWLRASRARAVWARRLYGRLGGCMSLSAVSDLMTLSAPGMNSGGVNWVAFAESVPFLVLIGFAATWKDGDGAVEEEQASSRIGVLATEKLLPLLSPVLVMYMTHRIARSQLTIAWLAIGTSFACSGARLFLTNAKLQQASEKLANSLQLLAAVSEGTTDAIFVKDLEGRYLMINGAGAGLLGKTINEVLSKRDVELLTPETGQKIFENDLAIMRAGKVQVNEEVVAAAGVTRTFLSTKGPYRDAEGKIIGLIGISRDITERLKLDNRMQQSQRLESIGILAGGIAHDFNNLLTVIRGYCSMLLDRPHRDEESVNPIRQIDSAAERAAGLTSQLLAFSRRQVLQPKVLNLNNILQDLQTLVRRLITEDIELVTFLDPQLAPVKADQSQMEQVIMNLVVNARDAMPEGGKITLETANVVIDERYAQEHGVAPLGSAVMLAVSDDGQGMTKEVLAHIFDPFYTTKPQGKGTGLGLSTVYGIIKQSGGYIWVYSEPGRGTSFKCYLPRVEGSPVPLNNRTAVAAVARGSETILVVEDDDALCAMVTTMLTRSGYSVLSAKTPHTALQVCRENSNTIQMMLTDVVMPGMNGRELARRIGAEWPRIKVLFMSGYTTNAIVHQGVLDSEVEFLQKPFSAEILRERVRQVLDGREPSHNSGD